MHWHITLIEIIFCFQSMEKNFQLLFGQLLLPIVFLSRFGRSIFLSHGFHIHIRQYIKLILFMQSLHTQMYLCGLISGLLAF